MAKGVITPQEKRDEIIAKIRDEGMSVAEASRQYDIGPKAIYSWMRDGVGHSSTSLILENNRLKKENEQLYNMLGRATVELKKAKK
ncbi:MAG: transposase [Candidatus Saccharimonadales bacterium]